MSPYMNQGDKYPLPVWGDKYPLVGKIGTPHMKLGKIFRNPTLKAEKIGS